MIPPIESIQYLVDVFIEGGYAEEEDLDHLDAIHLWLRDEEKARDAAFKKRITTKDVNPDYTTIRNMAGRVVSYVPDECYTLPDGSCVAPKCSLHLSPGWETDPRPFENPATMPVNRDGEDGPLDEENPPENRSTYEIVDAEGNRYFFTP